MTTIAALVAATPAATRGVPAGFTYGTGVWRHVVELADPAAGSSVEWFDITEWFTGSEYTRGADDYQGRYRASVATLDLFAPDDRFAPWNDDTSDTFGVNVSLGPGLLVRSGFILVAGGVVTEWNPRFTCKVEFWGDASYSQGKIRQHRIIARDTLTSLVGVPIGASIEENWSDRVDHVLTEAGWEYGYTLYGATTIGGVGVLPLPARDAQVSAINELDATVDPAGATWYTNRKGQLIVRPTVYDTWQAGRFTAGAAGTPYPEPDPVVFSWWSCSGDTPPGDYGDLDTAATAAYALDTPGIDPFGLDRSETSVINQVVVTSPSGTFDDEDPVSIQRYDRHTLQASWITANDFVAADILAARANATVEARPLSTTVRLEQFHPGPATVDVHDDIVIWHRNGNAGMEVNADGWLRSYRELVRPVGCDTDWSIAVTFDVFASESRNSYLLPVTNLELAAITDTVATFTWGNPTQIVTPTHTQFRMAGELTWTTAAYPITGVIYSALTPYTPYEFEVRLIRVEDTIITHFSPTRSVIFITADPTVPDVVTNPDDPDDIDVVFPPPDPGDPTCILEWELQSSPDGLDPWTTIDDGEITEPPYDLTYDTTALDPGDWYRFRSREVCGGVPGDWQYSDPFVTGCIPVSQLAVSPFDDANLVAYWPEVCPPSTISEAVSGEPMILGGAFDRVGFDAAGIPVMWTFGEGVIGYGVQPVAVAGSSDLSIQCRVNFGELPDVEAIIFGYGGLYLSATPSGSGYVVEGQCLEAGVGTISLASASVQAVNTEYVLTLTHEVGGTLSLYVDTTLEDSSVSTVGARGGTLGGLYQIGAPADSWVTDCGVWDIVLTINQPAPSAALLTTGSFSRAASSVAVTTASITPSSNALVLLCVAYQVTTPATAPASITGCGLTWVLVNGGDVKSSGTGGGCWLYRAMGSTPTTDVVTITPGENTNAGSWTIIEIYNVDTSGVSGAGAVVQAVTAGNAFVAKPVGVTLAAFSDPANAVVIAGSAGNRNEVPTGVAPLSNVGGINQTGTSWELNTFIAFSTTQDTTPQFTWTSVNSSWYRAVGLEIAAI